MVSTVFSGGQVFDGTGSDVRSADVLIEDGTIREIGEGLVGDVTVDVDGKVLIPGLFDCHVHIGWPNGYLDLMTRLSVHRDEIVLRFPATARSYLEMGITTVRDAGFASLGARTAIEKGIVVGPRLQIAIILLSPTGGHADPYMPFGGSPTSEQDVAGVPDPVCDGIDGCIAKTREVIRAGADVVKIAVSGGFMSPGGNPHHPTFSLAEIKAIVDTAADLGRPVMAHAHGAEAIKRAVEAGVRSIEHGLFLDEEGAAMMVEAGTWLVPTLTVKDSVEKLASDPDQQESVRKKFSTIIDSMGGGFQRAVENGVKIAMGTDSPISPHGTNLREFEHMVEWGLSPHDALLTATASAAALMGVDDQLGTLESGKIADVVVVDGDPFEFSTLGDRIEQVWKDGVQVV